MSWKLAGVEAFNFPCSNRNTTEKSIYRVAFLRVGWHFWTPFIEWQNCNTQTFSYQFPHIVLMRHKQTHAVDLLKPSCTARQKPIPKQIKGDCYDGKSFVNNSTKSIRKSLSLYLTVLWNSFLLHDFFKRLLTVGNDKIKIKDKCEWSVSVENVLQYTVCAIPHPVSIIGLLNTC